jgi:glycerol-3-phosphate dehydrogenase
MKRNLTQLSRNIYDLVVIGGGIFGICAAWDAILRGLSVALVEKGDFAHATSANSFKIVHGGMRYLQHADIYRIRESSQERSVLLRIAPHLVHPLPIVVPTYGHGLQSNELLRIGMLLYDLITFDRNQGIKDPERRIPQGRIISREESLELFPHLDREGLRGAAIFHDGQMYNPTRLVLSYLRSATEAGADAVNYTEVTDFLRDRNRVFGVKVRDMLSGDNLEIRGKVVLNAAGPWAERLLRLKMGIQLNPEISYSRDACFVVARQLTNGYALAVQGKTKDPDAILSRGQRHLFIAPWRKYTLIGVWHVVYKGEPDRFTVTQNDLQVFLDEINTAYSPLALTLKDISMWNAGLVPFGSNKPGATDLSYGKRSHIIDHARDHSVEGLITVIGIRYTTSRGVAAKAIDLVFKKMGKKPIKSQTAVTPISGGRIEHFGEFLHQSMEQHSPILNADVMYALVRNHGSEYRKIIEYINENPMLAKTVGASTVIKAEVVNAIREEMAEKLEDVVFRRTDLGSGGHPGELALKTCADLMASELGWDEGRVQREIEEVKSIFPHF